MYANKSCTIQNTHQSVTHHTTTNHIIRHHNSIHTTMYDLHKCTNNFDIINYTDDTTLISTINQFDNHCTGMNEHINNELRNVHNRLLAQRLSLNVAKNRLMMFLHATKKMFLL